MLFTLSSPSIEPVIKALFSVSIAIDRIRDWCAIKLCMVVRCLISDTTFTCIPL